MKGLESFLRPEFINRVDEIVYFHQLTEENFRGIAGIMLEELKAALEEKGRLVREHIAGRDAVYLRDMHDAEAYLAEMLGCMAERNYEYDFDVDELLSALLESSEFTFPRNSSLRFQRLHAMVWLS